MAGRLRLLEEAEINKYKDVIVGSDNNKKVGIVFCHGFTSTPQSIEPITELLKDKGYTICTPLLKGHGEEPKSLVGVESNDWIEGIKNSIKQLKETYQCEKIILAGLSMGGVLSLNVASGLNQISEENDLHVDGVIAINAPLKIPDIRMYFIPIVDIILSGLKKIRIIDEYPSSSRNKNTMRGENGSEKSYDYIPFEAVKQLRKLIKATKIKDIKCKILAIVSGYDGSITKRSFLELIRKIPSLYYQILYHDDHVPDYSVSDIASGIHNFIQKEILERDIVADNSENGIAEHNNNNEDILEYKSAHNKKAEDIIKEIYDNRPKNTLQWRPLSNTLVWRVDDKDANSRVTRFRRLRHGYLRLSYYIGLDIFFKRASDKIESNIKSKLELFFSDHINKELYKNIIGGAEWDKYNQVLEQNNNIDLFVLKNIYKDNNDKADSYYSSIIRVKNLYLLLSLIDRVCKVCNEDIGKQEHNISQLLHHINQNQDYKLVEKSLDNIFDYLTQVLKDKNNSDEVPIGNLSEIDPLNINTSNILVQNKKDVFFSGVNHGIDVKHDRIISWGLIFNVALLVVGFGLIPITGTPITTMLGIEIGIVGMIAAAFGSVKKSVDVGLKIFTGAVYGALIANIILHAHHVAIVGLTLASIAHPLGLIAFACIVGALVGYLIYKSPSIQNIINRHKARFIIRNPWFSFVNKYFNLKNIIKSKLLKSINVCNNSNVLRDNSIKCFNWCSRRGNVPTVTEEVEFNLHANGTPVTEEELHSYYTGTRTAKAFYGAAKVNAVSHNHQHSHITEHQSSTLTGSRGK